MPSSQRLRTLTRALLLTSRRRLDVASEVSLLGALLACSVFGSALTIRTFIPQYEQRSPSPYYDCMEGDPTANPSLSSAIKSLFSFTSPAVKKLLGWKQGDEEEKWLVYIDA